MNNLKEQIDMELKEMKAGKHILERARAAARCDEQGGEAKRGGLGLPDGKRVKKRRWTAVAAAVAFIFIAGCITAGASGMFGHFSDYFSGDTEPYSDLILQSVKHVENDSFVLGMDGIVSDNTQCMFVLNVEAKTREAENQMEKYRKKHGLSEFSDALTLTAYLKDGTSREFHGCSVFEYLDIQTKQLQSNLVTINVQNVGVESLEEVEKIQVAFEGLSLDAGLENLMPETKLKAKPGEMTGDAADVKLSPIGFSFQSKAEDVEVCLIRSDGTMSDGNENSCRVGFSRNEDDTKLEYYGDFSHQIIDLKDYSGMRINGVNYYK